MQTQKTPVYLKALTLRDVTDISSIKEDIKKLLQDRGIACEKCHGTMREVDLGTRLDLPRMPLCLGCHNANAPTAARGPARCSTCHLTRHDGTLETSFPTGTLVPSGTLKGDRHTMQFAVEHARAVQRRIERLQFLCGMLQQALAGSYRSERGLGKGLLAVSRLADGWQVTSAPGKGTTVRCVIERAT